VLIAPRRRAARTSAPTPAPAQWDSTESCC
jgi:hypothetical protein